MLTRASENGLVPKSNLILGMGEQRDEISQAMADLRAAGCELLTITQYLRPSVRHHPVDRWVRPEEFDELAEEAAELGFAGVQSGPLVRSSYRAGRLYRQAMERRRRTGILAIMVKKSGAEPSNAGRPRIDGADQADPDGRGHRE